MSTPAKIVQTGLPAVAIIGRVNVGKSTLFNRIVGANQALVSVIPGTTRTRNIAEITWAGKKFQLVDTGGLTFQDAVLLEQDIIAQTEVALKEADVILFTVDLREELLPQERELAKRLNESKTKILKNKNKIILVGNKADNERTRWAAYNQDWLKLGLGEPLPVSAVSGTGVGDLLDLVVKKLPKKFGRTKKENQIKPLRVAIVGKPNVGKSSLFNKLIGEERVIVSPMPHTTREPHDMLVELRRDDKTQASRIIFIDTAGIRRKAKVTGELERKGIDKSIAAIERADIVLLLLDANEPISDQDKQLGGLLREHNKSVIIVINKWDKADDNADSFRNEVKRRVYSDFPHLDFAPIAFVSAKTGYRVQQIFPLILRAAEERRTVIPQATLSDFMRRVIRAHRPARGKGTRHPQILGFKQVHDNPPIFEISIKAKTSVHFSYARYLENRLREQFSFFAAPIVIRLRKVKK